MNVVYRLLIINTVKWTEKHVGVCQVLSTSVSHIGAFSSTVTGSCFVLFWLFFDTISLPVSLIDELCTEAETVFDYVCNVGSSAPESDLCMVTQYLELHELYSRC